MRNSMPELHEDVSNEAGTPNYSSDEVGQDLNDLVELLEDPIVVLISIDDEDGD